MPTYPGVEGSALFINLDLRWFGHAVILNDVIGVWRTVVSLEQAFLPSEVAESADIREAEGKAKLIFVAH